MHIYCDIFDLHSLGDRTAKLCDEIKQILPIDLTLTCETHGSVYPRKMKSKNGIGKDTGETSMHLIWSTDKLSSRCR